MKYTVEWSGGLTHVEADYVRLDAGVLILVRGDKDAMMFGAGEWNMVREYDGPPDGSHETIRKKLEPAVPVKKLLEWIEKVKEASPSNSFFFDSELYALIREVGGDVKPPELPKPPPTEAEPKEEKSPKGKLD